MADLISVDQFKSIFPKAQLEFLDAFNNKFLDFGINTVNKASAFLSQTAVESACYTVFQENLNYSAEGLLETFPKYFNGSTAAQYAHNPVAIANHVYANRMGNGDESSGDGWNFHGRGIIQITGKQNYIDYASYKKCPLGDIISYLETFDGIIDSALWFWISRSCNKLAADPVKTTKRVNGGANGLEDRIDIFKVARLVLTGQQYTGSGFGGVMPASSKKFLSGAKDSSGSYDNTSVASTAARDSDTSKGTGAKTGKRIELTEDYYRDQFTCPSGCGADTVDVGLMIFLQKFSDKIDHRPVKIKIGTVCPGFNGLNCDQKSQHVLGKAAHIEVPAWADKGFSAMKAPDIVKILESMFGGDIYCYAVSDTEVHLDSGNT